MAKKKVYDSITGEEIKFDNKCMKVRCKVNNMTPYLRRKMKSTKHFENILLILIDQDYKQNNKANFIDLTNGDVMRAVLLDNEGGKVKDRVARMQEFYKDNELMKNLKEVAKSLKIHNLVEQIKDIKKNYDGYFTKIKNGDKEARPPKPKKLSKLNNVTIFTDGYKSWSYKMRKQSHKGLKIGINLDEKMRYTHLPHKYLTKVVGDMENINNININYSNGNFYFLINYQLPKTKIKDNEVLDEKWAGVDPGVDNLLSIYIDDADSKSMIIDNSNFIDYNVKFNRLVGNVSSEIQYNKNLKDEHKKGLRIDLELRRLYRYRNFLYEKRNNFFYSEFNKLSVRILEYLKYRGVTHVAIPNNLASLKYNGDCHLRKDIKQSFVQIPFVQLIHLIKAKSGKFGITVVDVDEAFTSKTSSLSQDIVVVKSAMKNYLNLWKLVKKDSSLSANVFKGRRAKRSFKESKGHRGIFWDASLNVMVNSDLNGAKNICSIGKGFKCVNYGLRKLCNPYKFKSDGELLGLLKQ